MGGTRHLEREMGSLVTVDEPRATAGAALGMNFAEEYIRRKGTKTPLVGLISSEPLIYDYAWS